MSLSTQAPTHLNISVPTSVHAYLCIMVRRHRGTASPVSPAVSRRNSRTETKAAAGAGLKSPGSSGELPQPCGAARFVVKLPVLFERKCHSTKVRRIKSPLPNTFYIQFCKGRKALVPEDARGPRARQGGDGWFCWKAQKQRMIQVWISP